MSKRKQAEPKKKVVKKVVEVEDRSAFNCQDCQGLGILPNGNICATCKGTGKI